MAKIRLGDLLVRAGVLDDVKLKAALAQQQRWGGRLGRVLVDMSFLSEDLLVKALSKQLGVPRAKLGESVIPAKILQQIGAAYAREHAVCPEHFDAQKRVLRLAMADPTQVKVIDELRFKTGFRVEATLGGELAISQEIDRIFEGRGPSATLGFDYSNDRGFKSSSAYMNAITTTGVAIAQQKPIEVPVGELPEITRDNLHRLPRVARPRRSGSEDISVTPEFSRAEDFDREMSSVGIGRSGYTASSQDMGLPASESANALAVRLEQAQRQQNKALRVMVELLIEKGVFTREEYLDIASKHARGPR